MSFLSTLFPTKSEQQAAAPAPANAATTLTANAPAAQAMPAAPAPAAPVDPLDDLWNNANVGSNPGLDYNINPEQLAQIAGKLDYSTVITDDIKQRLAAGGQDAVTATIEALNAVQRAGFQQNAAATTKLVQAALADAESKIDARIQKQLRLTGLNEQLAETHPALTNPRYAPVVDGIKQQIIAKFPNATQAEINKYTVRYFESMASDMNPDLANKANTNTQVGFGNLQSLHKETDWAEWLSQ